MIFSLCFSQNYTVIGVSDFVYTGEISRNDVYQIGEKIRSLIAQNKENIVIDYNLMSEILKAQNMQSYPPCDNKKCLIKLGKLISANKVIGGKASRNGNTIKIELLYVDVSDNKLINSIDSTIQVGRNDFFNYYLPSLCDELFKPSIKKMKIVSKQNTTSNIDTSTNKHAFFNSTYKVLGITAIVAAGGGVAYLIASHNSGSRSPNNDDIISLTGEPIRSRQ